MTTILDGKEVRDRKREELAERIARLGGTPKLVIIRVGEREDTKAYVAQKKKMGEKLGVEVAVEAFEESISEDDLLLTIGELNNTPGIHGVIVQLPLPDHINVFRVIEAVEAEKDVDGLTAINLKKLLVDIEDGFVPATAKGITGLLEYYDVPVVGKEAVVVGRSMLVGQPTAHALLNRDAAVTVAHSKTKNLAEITTRADILVVATGHPELITREYVSEGQTVVDVGINQRNGEHYEEEIPDKKFVGDVAFDDVKDTVGAISPVPGGVGPMTVVTLFENLIDAYERQHAVH